MTPLRPRPSRLSHRSRTRAPLAAAVVGALALLAAGCSSNVSDAASSPSATGATVQTLWGPVTVPAHPTRVVALGFPEATALADLGVTPVGRPTYIPELPAYTSLFKDVPVVEDADGKPDLEKIAALHPDLILLDEFADKKDKATYDKLSAIAPTVDLEWKMAAGNWPAEAQGTAEAVGKTAELDKLKADYQAHADRIKKDFADVLATHSVDLVSGDANNWYLYSEASSHGRVLVDGGARLGAAAGQKDGFVQYSPEHYDLLKDTDLIFVAGKDEADIKPVTSNAVFAATKAAKEGHVVATNYFFSSSYQIANALLDDFQRGLEELETS
ncbi:iron-siderophore ABC transporter substrate-binding protein [Luteimicrobium xylanilyticum]|uniref:Fe/B12 periplasmic-binding domain-containing protein n=1 Tax=Luteimicrobium xylanilyticum TaxID=1133546 RepID=A0A5P9Q635_9MICO|nr:ABC transporter substrate-binding protein [Luteimicrobium xylanilyticum]QFU96858.1 hypothetical protein KDY119_00348 [Luteimicrobium xylanilyticum]